MRFFALSLVCLLVSACAHVGHSSPSSWSEYRTMVLSERDRGERTPVEAQEMLRVHHISMFGSDPLMDGFYAYSIRLLRGAEDGKLPMQEALTLVDAREQEIRTMRTVELEQRSSIHAFREASD